MLDLPVLSSVTPTPRGSTAPVLALPGAAFPGSSTGSITVSSSFPPVCLSLCAVLLCPCIPSPCMSPSVHAVSHVPVPLSIVFLSVTHVPASVLLAKLCSCLSYVPVSMLCSSVCPLSMSVPVSMLCLMSLSVPLSTPCICPCPMSLCPVPLSARCCYCQDQSPRVLACALCLPRCPCPHAFAPCPAVPAPMSPSPGRCSTPRGRGEGGAGGGLVPPVPRTKVTGASRT